ncbi:hypothetical protein [Paenibacillus sp. USHLN196]|uniref:hypothetical protein n=1 Tax=Paenibacillus sp. USHLN196 TaxID=3081291 RepID=UPI003016970A
MKLGDLIENLKKFEHTYGSDVEVKLGHERSGELDVERIGGICGLGNKNKRDLLIYDIYSDLG